MFSGVSVGASVAASVGASIAASMGAGMGAETGADIDAAIGVAMGADIDAAMGVAMGAAVGAGIGAATGASTGEIMACCACVAWALASLEALEARLIWYLCIGAESSTDIRLGRRSTGLCARSHAAWLLGGPPNSSICLRTAHSQEFSSSPSGNTSRTFVIIFFSAELLRPTLENKEPEGATGTPASSTSDDIWQTYGLPLIKSLAKAADFSLSTRTFSGSRPLGPYSEYCNKCPVVTRTMIFLSISTCVTLMGPEVLEANLPSRAASPLRVVSVLPLALLSVGTCSAPTLLVLDFAITVSGAAVETSTKPFFVDRAKAWNNGGAS